jgi:protein TonB
MHTKYMPEGDLLDILFEHRNKEYGAYLLRRQYPAHLRKGVLISLLLSGLGALLLWQTRDNLAVPVSLAALPVEISQVIIPPPTEAVTPPPSESRGASAPAVRDIVPVIVPDQVKIDHPVPAVDDLADALPASDDRLGDPGLGASSGNAAGGASAAAVVDDAPPVPAVYDFTAVEIPAQFPGGARALKRFLERHLQVPEPGAGEASGPVKVLVKFVVGADGRTGQPELLVAGGDAYDEEVLRVLGLMPRWTPARQNQRSVAMYFVLPVVFDRITDQ